MCVRPVSPVRGAWGISRLRTCVCARTGPRQPGEKLSRQKGAWRTMSPAIRHLDSPRLRASVAEQSGSVSNRASNRGGSELEFPVNHSKETADPKSNRNFLSLWFLRTASLPGRVSDAFAGRGIFSSHSFALRIAFWTNGPLVTRLPAVAGHCISNRHSCRLELPVTLTKHSADALSNRHSIRPTICAQFDAHPENACLGWRQESSRII